MQKKISTSLVASLLLATTNLFSAQSLETITVTSATNTTQSIKDVTSNIDIITKEDIEEKHYSSVVDALNTIPGISFTSNGSFGASSSVYLRGNDSKRILVLIDGIRYNDITGTSGAPFEHLMIDDIEQIEVVKGAQSGIWGADASAGVINIITKSAKSGTHGDASIEYGSFDTKKYGMNLSHKTDKYYLKGSVYKTDTDGYSSFLAKKSSRNYGKRGNELGLEDDGYKNLTSSLKAGYNFDDSNKIDVSHTIVDADNNFDGTSGDSLNTANTKDQFSTVSYENKNNFATTDVSAKRSDFDREYYYPATNSTSYFDGIVNEYGLKTNIPYQNGNSFVLLGTDYKTFEHKNELNEKYDNKALFLTNSNKFNDNKTIITESLRKDAYDKFDNKTTGKVGIKQYIWNELNVSSNYGTAYNVPTLYNLYSTYGSKDINPESSKSYDVGVEYKGISATYFHTKIEDMIDFDTNTYKYGNIDGTSTLKGYELAYKKDVLEDTFLNLNYTSLSAEDNNGQELARRAKEQVGFGVDYYGIKDFHFNVNGQYIGDRYNGVNKTGAETGNYTVWNSVVNYDINKTYKAYLKVNNLFDKYYQTVDGYATEERSAYIGLKANF
ncbi:MAG: TonB-dependent receptor [Aliarcobacter sp.]|nr:TonB-dependent receptor [Aliarcobacter sp.]